MLMNISSYAILILKEVFYIFYSGNGLNVLFIYIIVKHPVGNAFVNLDNTANCNSHIDRTDGSEEFFVRLCRLFQSICGQGFPEVP